MIFQKRKKHLILKQVLIQSFLKISETKELFFIFQFQKKFFILESGLWNGQLYHIFQSFLDILTGIHQLNQNLILNIFQKQKLIQDIILLF